MMFQLCQFASLLFLFFSFISIIIKGMVTNTNGFTEHTWGMQYRGMGSVSTRAFEWVNEIVIGYKGLLDIDYLKE